MDRGTRNLFALLLVVVVAITGGAALILGGSAAGGPDPSADTEAVVGVIVAVEGDGLAAARGFTLRRTGGELMVFRLDRLENGTEFPPGHLAEHQATSEAVRVSYRDDAGTLYAIRLEDGGP
jgi:hypothetical protein